MKKYISNLFMALAIVFGSSLFVSCEDEDDDKIEVSLSLSSDVDGTIAAEDIAGATITLVSTQSKDVYTATVPETINTESADVVFASVPVGTYDISMETTNNGKTIFVRKENVTIKSAGQFVDLLMITTVANDSDFQFIFSEVFFNGETNAGRMMHPDQYMVIYNPTDNVLYADGLAIGCTMQNSNGEKKSWFDSYYNDNKIPVHGIIVVPGSGYDFPVKPRGKFVIAFSASNHTLTEGTKLEVTESGDTIEVSYTYENAADLSGADFEIYDPQVYKSDIDNPEVPNVKEIFPAESDFGGIGGFYLHPRGFYCPFIFKLKNGEQSTLEEFYKENSSVAQVADKEGNNVDIQMLSVPMDMILDGITTGHIPTGIVTNPLTSKIDRGCQLVKGCHSRLLVKRKGNDKDGYADTNDSSVDCELVTPQSSFPIGWRD